VSVGDGDRQETRAGINRCPYLCASAKSHSCQQNFFRATHPTYPTYPTLARYHVFSQNATHPTYPTLARYHVFSQNATHPTYPTYPTPCRLPRDLLLTLPPILALHVSLCRCCTIPLSGDIVGVRAGRKGVFAPPGMYIRRMVRFLKSLCEILFGENECVGVYETSRTVTERRGISHQVRSVAACL
jgi:hypothetical protein